MIAYLPIPGGHIALAKRFVDPGFSFAMGWNYWYDTCARKFVAKLTAHSISLLGTIGLLCCLRNLVQRQC
jgi:amino acid permease